MRIYTQMCVPLTVAVMHVCKTDSELAPLECETIFLDYSCIPMHK